jgi:hypothetical protein
LKTILRRAELKYYMGKDIVAGNSFKVSNADSR